MSQVTKLPLKIVMDRMKWKIEAELDDAQSGFRQGKGTREGLLNIRLICEIHLDFQKYVSICFVDYERGFDSVRHEPLVRCLSEIGDDGKYTTNYQYEGCQRGRQTLQQSQIF